MDDVCLHLPHIHEYTTDYTVTRIQSQSNTSILISQRKHIHAHRNLHLTVHTYTVMWKMLSVFRRAQWLLGFVFIVVPSTWLRPFRNTHVDHNRFLWAIRNERITMTLNPPKLCKTRSKATKIKKKELSYKIPWIKEGRKVMAVQTVYDSIVFVLSYCVCGSKVENSTQV